MSKKENNREPRKGGWAEGVMKFLYGERDEFPDLSDHLPTVNLPTRNREEYKPKNKQHAR